jgi:dihydroflavonol-4-reductase
MANKGKVLVTGATGFVALHCIAELLKNGYEVVGTLRTKSREKEVRNGIEKVVSSKKLKFVETDLIHDSGWEEGMSGCKYVMHIAMPFMIAEPKDPHEIFQPTVEGTKRVLGFAKKAGVKRVVLSSSAYTVGQHNYNGTYDHDDWTDHRNKNINTYVKAKTLQELAAWEFISSQTGKKKLELSSLLLGAIFGPALTAAGQTRDLCKQLIEGKQPMVPDLHVPVVDARDSALAHLKAMETNAANGKRLIIANPDVGIASFESICRILRENGFNKAPKMKAPTFLVKLMGLFDKEARGMAPLLGKKIDLDSSLTKETLKWEPTIPIEKMIIDLANSINS